MMVNNLVLFGKHPAWSDHMFISDDTSVSHYLKRVFYDHSVIPALQGGDGDQRISETWSFLVFVNDQAFFIVNAISRDSVGRRRFPLIVAYPLPPKLKLESSLESLRELKKELLSLLDEMLEAPGEDLNQWQEEVAQKVKSFKSEVDWSSVESDKSHRQLKRDLVVSLMSRLANDSDALDLKSCSFPEACCLIQLGLKQFKSWPPAMLILDQEERGTGLFFLTEGNSFKLNRHLYNNLTGLTVSENNISPKVSRLLKSALADGENVLSIDKVPSLKLSPHHSPVSTKFIILAVSLALIVSILFGLFYGCSESCPDSADSSEVNSTERVASNAEWSSNAKAYVEWIQPLIAFVDERSTPVSGFDAVASALKFDLNPFAVVGTKEASIKLAINPPNEYFNPVNNAKLKIVYGNIDQLKTSLIAYYEDQFSDDLIKELKRQNYNQPSFIKVDFSQQPIMPDFGPGLIRQLKSHIASKNMLSELVTKTKALWDSIIKPLHHVCPEHAKFVQRYVQNLIVESDSPEQFKDQYTELLQIFGYPEFIKLDDIDMDELSEDADWLNLPEKEQSVESLHKLVELLEANQKSKVQSQPADVIEQNPVSQSVQSGKQVFQSSQLVPESGEQVVSESGKQVLKSGEGMVESGEKTLKSTEQSALDSGKKALKLSIDLAEWDFFLSAGLEQFEDDRLLSAIKGHAEAIRTQILEDTTLEGDQALLKYKEQIAVLIVAFKRLDVSSMQDSSIVYANYLEKEQPSKRLSDYLFDEYVAANIEKGDVGSINEVSQEISIKTDTYLTGLYGSFADLETNYFSTQVSETGADLSEQINAITENPLYVEGLFGSHLEIIKAAVAGDTIRIKTSQDLLWFTKNLASRSILNSTELAMITESFNALDLTDQSSELGNAIRLVFDKHVQTLRASNPKAVLALHQNLATYLPEKLHTSQDKGFQQIARYWSRYKASSDAAAPNRTELETLKNSAASLLAKQFYAELLDKSDGMNSQSSSSALLDQISRSSGVESVFVSDDRSLLEVTFKDNFGKLAFLPLETEAGTVFVQRTPLSLEQYIKLSNICNFDTEYYLTLQDSLWPRAFEVGVGLGFSILSEWQFRNKDAFAPINAFNKKTLPAHLNEPAGILKMAKFFGFRLLSPDECAAFIRLADRSSVNRLKFSVADREKLKNSNAIQSSVYAELIADSMEQDAWSGGIDFERGAPNKNQFFDVAGGSAELAYDGTDFYALGGSWLYEPSVLEKPVRIAEPRRIYMDLGIRFAIDAPTQSYSKLVQKVALQFVAESK